MDMPVNHFRRGLKEGRLQLGFWSLLGSPAATEILGNSGADWVLVDMEHAPNELPDVVHQLRALAPTRASAIVRPPWNDMVTIKRLLDAGVQSLLIPFVQNADEARAAVAHTRYPPDGVRGVSQAGRTAHYGRVPRYLNTAAEEIAVMVQIETLTAVGNLEAIAAVPGLDGIFVGPSDLAASMGHLGDPMHPEVQAVIADVARRMKATGTPAGIYTQSEAHAKECAAMGYSVLCVGADLGFVLKGADGTIRGWRS